jgi:hypothetical protein
LERELSVPLTRDESRISTLKIASSSNSRIRAECLLSLEVDLSNVELSMTQLRDLGQAD